MQGDFATVVWVVGIAGIGIALISLIGMSRTWRDFGRGRFVMDRDEVVAPKSTPAALAERDSEIRQMLEARNARRARRGEDPLDVEAELRRLTAPAIDEELRQEIRDLVIARNVRRARRGEPPLDVEAEIAREIAGLEDLGR